MSQKDEKRKTLLKELFQLVPAERGPEDRCDVAAACGRRSLERRNTPPNEGNSAGSLEPLHGFEVQPNRPSPFLTGHR